jgi:hypothetical protein
MTTEVSVSLSKLRTHLALGLANVRQGSFGPGATVDLTGSATASDCLVVKDPPEPVKIPKGVTELLQCVTRSVGGYCLMIFSPLDKNSRRLILMPSSTPKLRIYCFTV